ncbi:MAG: squalene/phytoene synthase family protein [Rhodanobacteraceae bacterium]
MSGGAFESYLSSWREADPRRTLAWWFLRSDERIRYGANAALIQEWRNVLRAREPQVAMAKLGWWREELQRSAEGGARHPLTQALFADARIREVPLDCWTMVVDAALRRVEAPPSADFAAQLSASAPFAGAVAELETRVWFGSGVSSARAAVVTTTADLVADARALVAEAERGRPALPMNLMARHGLTIESLQNDGPARRAALRDHLFLLRDALGDATVQPGRLTLFREIDMQHDLGSLGHAVRAADPLAALCISRPGLDPLLKTWRAARTWRGTDRREVSP